MAIKTEDLETNYAQKELALLIERSSLLVK